MACSRSSTTQSSRIPPRPRRSSSQSSQCLEAPKSRAPKTKLSAVSAHPHSADESAWRSSSGSTAADPSEGERPQLLEQVRASRVAPSPYEPLPAPDAGEDL